MVKGSEEKQIHRIFLTLQLVLMAMSRTGKNVYTF
uniref:Uncharacterized protein n=1 Tax=Aegilops tauschii subsp. strangulata TaxID=200361 RepID=A0A453D0N7_AEGTS